MSRPAAPRILHLHAAFDEGGAALRCVRLINAFGKAAEHGIVSGDLDRRGAARFLAPAAKVKWPRFPALRGRRTLGRLKRLAEAMQGYDLICTYGGGAMDGALAHTLFADVCKLPPLVHHADGFEEGEAKHLKWWRNLYRRIALGRTAALVVPSRELERIALETWQQPRTRVRLIPNGIDTRAYGATPPRDALPRLVKRKDEYWIGTMADLRAVKNLTALVAAIRGLPEAWQLVIAGEGPEREAIVAEAEAQGVEHRVHLPGIIDQPWKLIGLFDIFALSSHCEQFPTSVVEAMAAGLPIAAPRAGDVGAMVASDNGPFLFPPGDDDALANTLKALANDPEARHRIGTANRARAREEYDEARMIERYRALYFGLAGRP